MTKALTLQDYLEMARRHIWLLTIPPVLLAAAAFSASFLLQPRYTSQTLVLVEGQKVAESLVKSAVTEDLNERLLTIKEQILSRARLEPIMQKYSLYQDEINKRATEDLIDEMRNHIEVDTIHGEKEGSTTGFYISFTADNPKLAQDVCAEITSLFMEENLKLREERAVGTTDFLANRLAESKRTLDEQDAKLAAFERKYMGKLPGEQTVNMNMLSSLQTQLDTVTQVLNRAQQDKIYAESLLQQEIHSLQAVQRSPEGLPASQVDDELQKLKQSLASLEARYTPEHPDVIRTKEMIANLEKSVHQNGATEETQTVPANTAKETIVASPTIQRLKDNIHALDVTIREKSNEQYRLQKAIQQYESRLELTPEVEEQYKQLTRDYQTAQALHDDLLKKKSESEMSMDLERRQEGEQFRVVDPANLPQRPSFPNRIRFVQGGFGAGLCLGVGLVLLLELSRKVIRSESDVEFYLKLPLLVNVPDLSLHMRRKTSLPARKGWRGRKGDVTTILQHPVPRRAGGELPNV